MSKKEVLMNGVLMEEGRIYLRDSRNGVVHQYDPLLAQMNYIERFEYKPGDEDKPLPEFGRNSITLSGLERGALYDKLAGLKPNERDAELAKLSAEDRASMADMGLLATDEVVNEESEVKPDEPKKKYKMKEDAEFSYSEYLEKGWTNEQLIAEGILVEAE